MLILVAMLTIPDFTLMAENEHDMQRNLNLLNYYCNCNKLKVNISKTKIMVFARSKTSLNNIPTFKFGNIDLEQVDDYISGMGRLLRPKNYFTTKLQKLCIH